MWDTSIVFPALVLAPVTIAFGPITAYNVLCVTAVASSAWCGYLAARRFTRSWWAVVSCTASAPTCCPRASVTPS
jgi:hypothetical protein